jgi:YfiH family protein
VFHWRDDSEGLTRAFTSRRGGVSAAPYDSLNLGSRVGDDPADVTENRNRVASALGVPAVAFMNQCHGADVAVIEAVPDCTPDADALVTLTPGLALAALVADCTPVLLWDVAGPAVAAVHAGRPGMMKGVVGQVVSTMRDLGAQSISAVVGPSVCSRCYEVPLALREEAASVTPESRAVSWTGTPAIDVAGGVVAQLHDLHVDISWVAGCAREDLRLFSHRRDGVTGRFGGFIVRKAP